MTMIKSRQGTLKRKYVNIIQEEMYDEVLLKSDIFMFIGQYRSTNGLSSSIATVSSLQ